MRYFLARGSIYILKFLSLFILIKDKFFLKIFTFFAFICADNFLLKPNIKSSIRNNTNFYISYVLCIIRIEYGSYIIKKYLY